MATQKLSYVFALGPNELEQKSLFLLRSIRQNTSASQNEIYVFIAEEEKEEISKETIKEVRNSATIIRGNIPIKEYPLSAAHKALHEASNKSESEYLLLLDTDTLVLNEPKTHLQHESDLFLKPVDTGESYWGQSESNKEWKQLFQDNDLEFPEEEVISTVDKRKVRPPYYNGGAILTRNNAFPKEYLDLNKKVYGTLSTDNYYTDQIVLAILAEKYNVEELDESYNYPQHLRFVPNSSANILHYHELYRIYLPIIISSKLRNKTSKTQIQGYMSKSWKKILYYIGKDIIEKTQSRTSFL